MVHVAVYADETYMDDGYIFMGGYVASVDEWLRIVTPWLSILNEHPRVPYFSNHGFKSKKWCCENGVNLSDMHLLPAKTVKLASVIAASAIRFSARSAIWCSHFRSEILSHVLALKNPKYELLRDPYYFLYSRFLSLLLLHLRQGNECLPESDRLSPIDVFVDENGKLGINATDLFFMMKRVADADRATLMGTAAPRDDKKAVPLQCADLYIGQLREWYISQTVTDAMKVLKSREFRPPFSDIGAEWKRGQLKEFASKLSGLPEEHWLKVDMS